MVIAALWGGPHDGTELEVEGMPDFVSIPLLVELTPEEGQRTVRTEHYQYKRTNHMRNGRVFYRITNIPLRRADDVT
jgi:hypothetical protein